MAAHLKFMRQLKRHNLATLSPVRLARLWENIWESWHAMNTWGHIPNQADFEHFMLSQKINHFLERRAKDVVGLPSVPELFVTLTTTFDLTPLQQQDEDMLELLAWIQERARLRHMLRRKTLTVEQVRVIPEFWRRLRRHTSKYDWLQFHYDGPSILTEQYFLETLASSERQGVRAAAALRALRRQRVELKRQQKRLWQVLPLSPQERHWILVAREFMYLKGLRKEAIFESCRLLDPFIQECARRLALTPLQTRQITTDELPAVLRRGWADANERFKFSVIRFKGKRGVVYTGRRAALLAKQVANLRPVKLSQLKGMCAYPGKAKGEVCVIAEANQMGKMKAGNILVSPATNPNLMPAIQLASAIVTNEGGITCHAAIVSRELKIPCVIGTKIATRALKDGDRVEVNATAGIVRKL